MLDGYIRTIMPASIKLLVDRCNAFIYQKADYFELGTAKPKTPIGLVSERFNFGEASDFLRKWALMSVPKNGIWIDPHSEVVHYDKPADTYPGSLVQIEYRVLMDRMFGFELARYL